MPPLTWVTISFKKTVCIFVLGSQAKLLLICSMHFDWKLRVDLISFRFFQDFVLAFAACRTQIPLLSIISPFIIIVSHNPLFISRFFFVTLLQEIELFIYVISNFCNNNLFNISLWRSHVLWCTCCEAATKAATPFLASSSISTVEPPGAYY